MMQVETVVVLGNITEKRCVPRLIALLDFLGIPWRLLSDSSAAEEELGDLLDARSGYVVLAQLTSLGRDLERSRNSQGALSAFWKEARAVYLYSAQDPRECSEALRQIAGLENCSLVQNTVKEMCVRVSSKYPELTGPMSGLRAHVRIVQRENFFALEGTDCTEEPIIEGEDGVVFFKTVSEGFPLFLSSSSEIPDLAEPVKGGFFDVRDNFCISVPLMMFLKWACQSICWQSSEAGACLIIDDPVLKPKYGCFEFSMVDRLMRESCFTTNIAFIPWNWCRTNKETASLIRNSQGHFSVSVHGCDHLRDEFGTTSVNVLNGKVVLAKQRMEYHAQSSGIRHDWIMVFPQGVFSSKSMQVLQQQQFIAAVNTEVVASDCDVQNPSIGDLWNVAMMNYSSFPLFTRRYPSQGLENFSFDLLLGKPCLIVEHHEYFKNKGIGAKEFIKSLNSLDARLYWRPLGEVIRRAYLWRKDSSSNIKVKMFGNEVTLKNDGDTIREFIIEKPDIGSVGVKEVLNDDKYIDWHVDGDCIRFACKIAPGTEALIKVKYLSFTEISIKNQSLLLQVKIAARRYLSEIRDNMARLRG